MQHICQGTKGQYFCITYQEYVPGSNLEDWPELGSTKIKQYFSHSTGPGRNHKSVRPHLLYFNDISYLIIDTLITRSAGYLIESSRQKSTLNKHRKKRLLGRT